MRLLAFLVVAVLFVCPAFAQNKKRVCTDTSCDVNDASANRETDADTGAADGPELQLTPAGRLQVKECVEIGGLDGAGACKCRESSTDRIYTDKDCDAVKETGEEYDDELGASSSSAVVNIVPGSGSPHFPIVGFGSNVTGGYGKTVFTVTTLTNAAPDGTCGVHCSFRDALQACNAAGGGYVVFTGLSGELDFSAGGGNMTWDCDNSTVDGATGVANQGIQLVGGGVGGGSKFFIAASNVIFRHVRFRCAGYTGTPSAPGCVDTNRDVVEIQGGDGVVMDHISVEWGADGNLDLIGLNEVLRNVTIQHSLIAETIEGNAVLISDGADRITFYRNAFISNSGRNPAYAPSTIAYGVSSSQVEYVENYTYNFLQGFEFQTNLSTLIVTGLLRGNVWQPGPDGDADEKIPVIYKNVANLGVARVYADNNRLLDGAQNWRTINNGFTGKQCDVLSTTSTNTPCSWPATLPDACNESSEAPCGTRLLVPDFTELTFPSIQADDVKRAVLDDVGANMPCSDSLDLKVIRDANSLIGPALPLVAVTVALPTLTSACP